MKITPRVLKTAQFPGKIKTPAQREQKVQNLCDDFYIWLITNCADKMEKRPNQFSQEGFEDYLMKKHPTVNVDVETAGIPNGYGGGVAYKHKGSRHSVSGFLFCLPIFNSKENIENSFSQVVWDLTHEHFHFLDYLLHPKKAARESEVEEILGKSNYQKAWKNCFLPYVYNSKLPGLTSKTPEKNRNENIKTHIQAYFKKERFSSNQKISLLQAWRNSISSEIGAYKESSKSIVDAFTDLEFQSSPEKMTKEQEKAQYKKLSQKKENGFRRAGWFAFEKRFYPQKYDLLNQMLKEEIATHRKAHAEALKTAPCQHVTNP